MYQSLISVVRAIDVGYGNTKFTKSNFIEGCGLDLFPSLAPLQTNKVKDEDNLLNTGKTIDVEVNGAVYSVGVDARNSASTTFVRTLEENFSLSDTYMALIKGALYEMKIGKIEMLVLGLPLNVYDQYRLMLRSKIIGKHVLPNAFRTTNPDCAEEVVCEILDVMVVPQPIGAFLSYTVPRGLNSRMSNEINMAIDIGRGTFDWFVTRGNNPIRARCGACFGGTSKIALNVANAHNPKIKENLSLMDQIEDSLYTKEDVHISKEYVNFLTRYHHVVSSTVRDAVNSMLATVGDTMDIVNVLITGGGAELYRKEIELALPHNNIIMDENPIFSNARGFQLAGEQQMLNKRKAA